MRGPLFVSFEGIDGSGKSTQIERLAAHLEGAGRRVRVFREPGGTELGERIRELLLAGGDVVPWAEASLFAASRAQLVATEIRPALEAGFDVICDRYLDSSVAYQGLARGLGEEAVRDWNLRVTGGLLPDLTFLLALSAEDAASRMGGVTGADRGEGARPALDRLERESLAFRERVALGYADLARSNPERVVALDAMLPEATIARRISDRIDVLLGVPLAAR
jgi:dTMP kinase